VKCLLTCSADFIHALHEPTQLLIRLLSWTLSFAQVEQYVRELNVGLLDTVGYSTYELPDENIKVIYLPPVRFVPAHLCRGHCTRYRATLSSSGWVTRCAAWRATSNPSATRQAKRSILSLSRLRSSDSTAIVSMTGHLRGRSECQGCVFVDSVLLA
jgi:hypothetical protein